mgnify:CR=1 FL=1
MRGKCVNLFLVSALLLITGCSSDVKLEPKKDVFEVEYGKKISTKAKDYFKNESDVLSKVTLDTKIKNQKDKDYADIGEYTLTFIYDKDKEKKFNVKVVVKDTTAPKFKDLAKEYSIEQGSKLSADMFVKNITDLDEVEITIDDKNVNYEKAGTYTATIIVKDKSGNGNKQEITVKVNEKKEAVSNESAGNSNQSSSGGSNNSGNSGTVPPSSNAGGDNGSSNNQPVTPPTTPPAEKPTDPPTCKVDIGNSGMLFDTEAEAIAWAEQKCLEDGYETILGYGAWTTCGKWTVDFTYY